MYNTIGFHALLNAPPNALDWWIDPKGDIQLALSAPRLQSSVHLKSAGAKCDYFADVVELSDIPVPLIEQ